MSQYSDVRPIIRIGTIVWGGILLLVSVVAATITFVDPATLSASFYLWSVVVFGALLVLAGLIGAIVRASMSRRTTDDRQTTYVETGHTDPDTTTDPRDLFS